MPSKKKPQKAEYFPMDGQHRAKYVKQPTQKLKKRADTDTSWKKMYLKEVLPVVGIDQKVAIEHYATRVANGAPTLIGLTPLQQYLILAVHNSIDYAELRERLHISWKQINRLMELTT